MSKVIPATLCYIRQNGKTLMLYRNKKKGDVHQGKYNGLGGKMESGESPEECVIREVLEESGLTITNPKLCGIMTFPNFRPREDWIVFAYTANHFTGSLTQCSEGTLEWINDDKILQLHLWEGDKIFWPWILEGRFFSAKFIYENGVLINHTVNFYCTSNDSHS